MGDDAAPRFGLGQRKDRIGRAAGLERADFLEILALEPEPRADRGVERATGHHRRAQDVRRDPRVGRADDVEIDGDVGATLTGGRSAAGQAAHVANKRWRSGSRHQALS